MERFEVKIKHNPSPKTQKVMLIFQIILRILGFAFCLGAVWRIMTSKQVLFLGLDARYTYSPSMKFFAYANIIGCTSSVVSLFLVLICCYKKHLHSNKYFFYLFLHDLFVFGLLVAGCAAATSIGYVGKYGQKHSGWNPICTFVPKFCHKATLSLILSYIAIIFYLCLTIISANQSRHIIKKPPKSWINSSMDYSSPSVRITRGTPFFVKVVDNPPSFSIGLTQDFGFNAGSVAKAKQVQASDIKIVEGGSMRKIVNSDSEDIESASSDLDKPKDHQEHQVLA
ncbi:CASP-like protein 1F1 [Solanum verrucosum]|uniref:CASP-like protein 1F1 n=1 Tax=Solanum verrucosum TaxID=315347 RepID=UPI0020D18915|nr:CASP-like protein 1F1 [Solanum verrucosum]